MDDDGRRWIAEEVNILGVLLLCTGNTGANGVRIREGGLTLFSVLDCESSTLIEES